MVLYLWGPRVLLTRTAIIALTWGSSWSNNAFSCLDSLQGGLQTNVVIMLLLWQTRTSVWARRKTSRSLVSSSFMACLSTISVFSSCDRRPLTLLTRLAISVQSSLYWRTVSEASLMSRATSAIWCSRLRGRPWGEEDGRGTGYIYIVIIFAIVNNATNTYNVRLVIMVGRYVPCSTFWYLLCRIFLAVDLIVNIKN